MMYQVLRVEKEIEERAKRNGETFDSGSYISCPFVSESKNEAVGFALLAASQEKDDDVMYHKCTGVKWSAIIPNTEGEPVAFFCIEGHRADGKFYYKNYHVLEQ